MIAAGYEDGNDASDLRRDPLFKMALDRAPSDRELCSQPTISRLENQPDGRSLLRMGRAMVDLYCASFRQVPKRIVLDIDDTFDAVHGSQQLRLFNAHYDEYGVQPIVVFDGEGRFVTAVLRPAKRPKGTEIRALLRRLVRAIRANWPATAILLRADSHYCGPEVLDWCRASGVDFIFGVAPTSTLRRHVERLEASTMARYSGVRLTGRITGFFEEVPAFVGAEQGADVAQGGPERLERARSRAAQERFDLGERHLDGVQIGRVLREEQEPGAPRLERLCGAGALVDREIVRDHDVAGPKGRGELGLDIGVERRAIHGAIHHPRGGEPVTPECSDEGLSAPAAERRRSAQALSATAAPAQPRHLGVDRGLVDEHQACRLKPHAGLTPFDPLPSSLPDIGAFALRRHQLFFYM